MPALIPTDFTATITWLGRVDDRASSLRSTPLQEVTATFAGVDGEEHAGLTRPSCSRVTSQYPKGTEIRNVRQFSVLSAEELAEIAAGMGLDSLDPALVGASLVQAESGATLVVDMENRPCHLPAKPIDEDTPGYGRAFKTAAKGRRGVTAWVECEGLLRVGETMRLHVPDQRQWLHLDQVLSI